MNKSDLKIGDKVKWNGEEEPTCFGFNSNDVTAHIKKGAALTIVNKDKSSMHDINVKGTTPDGFAFTRWVDSTLFDLVETGYVIKPLMPPLYRGAKVQVRQLESEDWSKEPHILVGRIDGAAKSNCCVDNNVFDVKAFEENRPFNTVNWRFARHYIEKEYEPYTEPKLEWIGEEVTQDVRTYNIVSIRLGNLIELQAKDPNRKTLYLTLDEIFKYHKKDGKPFGKEVAR